MSTYKNWTIITMPTAPPPHSIEFTETDIVTLQSNPFTGGQQTGDWNERYLAATVSMPKMPLHTAMTWIAFLLLAKGPCCVFQLPPSAAALVPSGSVPGTYWRLATGTQKWSVTEGFLYGIEFDIREAI